MSKAEYPDFRLLGKQNSQFPTHPDASILETFPNRSPNRDYWITLDCQDFTSLCPVTGQPDFAQIKIRYIPHASCIETKSLKFYLAGFRNYPAFNEQIVNKILDDLVSCCQPRRMTVIGEFSARGGIQLTVEATYP
ncbi:MAG: preQ(1) synthase [Chthoniobacterales bacterium]|nr:preQ(1) synthase [Chthoniobacterales bacterium]